MSDVVRPTLGAYMSVECFRYLRLGAEDTAGRAIVVAAGKGRGHSLEDHLKGINPDDVAQIKATLGKMLGAEGTRLCVIENVEKTDGGYQVTVSESACSTGMTSDEPFCAYTLGVFIGAMEVITGKRIYGQELNCVAMKDANCVYKLDILG